MYCQNCGTQNLDTDKYCTECGANLETNSKEKVIVNNVVNNSVQAPPSQNRQICLVCKGKGKKVNKMHLITSLLLGLVVFPVLAMATGGIALFGSIFILVWGFSKKKCKTCRGSGYLTM